MNEQEVLYRLSELIDQHDLEDAGDESSSTQELLQKISRHLENAPSVRSPTKAGPGARFGDTGAMMSSTKRTPYDVWKERNPDKLQAANPSPALTETQWEQLVTHLHETRKRGANQIMKKQNQGLAHELDGLSFQPKLNKISIELAANNKTLHQRLPAMIEKKEQHMKKQKEEQINAELQECTFSPQLQGGKKAQEYLRRSRRPLKRRPEDFFNYASEIKQRNLQRKQIIEDVESRELTFHPQLNRKSMIIQQRIRREGKIEVDAVTGQTYRNKTDSARNSESGESEKAFQPQISERAQVYKSKEEGPVYDRLYRRAMDREQGKRTVRTAEFTAHLQNLPQKAWERDLNEILAFQVQSTKSYIKKGDTVRVAMLDNENRPITVVEHTEAVRSIWESLINSDPIRFTRDMY